MKITKTWARRTLKAVDELIGQYKDGTHDGTWSNCPLCIEFDQGGGCERCPWMFFKGYKCLEYGRKYRYNNDPTPLRLRRLYGWRVRLKNIINKEATR